MPASTTKITVATRRDHMTLYQTPFGSFDTEGEAHAACEQRDLDPIACTKIVRPRFTDVCQETAYDTTVRLPFQIRVF